MLVRSVFVFNGSRADFPAGVFSDRELAIAWIKRHGLSGTLTEYPVDVGIYDWATENGHFKPKRAEQETPLFMQGFTSAAQWHVHFVNGTSPGVGDETSTP